MTTVERIKALARESLRVKERFFEAHAEDVARAAELMIAALRSGRKILLFGNGGSAADAQHIAAELVNRYRRERPALAALALTTDTSILTSIANDASFEDVFSRQIEALGEPGDVAVAISTSGRSPNVVRAVEVARRLGLRTIGLLGRDGGLVGQLVDVPLIVPSDETARIQETHITLGHILCELIESAFSDAS
ncbi:MAG: D-sedoheptulose 7-phosphate isomerase [Blastocatellia bacterium]|nr:D-sedoheptulose 7-phosphate isomerase [Blastocatellia bacterium]MCS7157441.1 D-sedoheptulose 7-phosphate isomerase [Blastocatellia bacterium]MCX7752614.1 D-sedoheptulose 7-phosphate isomerase [Blastocatellia bacterium]MDW8168345.1 D-sedoheptulose 7-phosphate isomerase [Acidobacteriota bacterium]MDW8255541.1 D-sedoheptulose 7-phosphate isomerase [Acidobacteriota bacterium]